MIIFIENMHNCLKEMPVSQIIELLITKLGTISNEIVGVILIVKR